jgi:hypothetical protein
MTIFADEESKLSSLIKEIEALSPRPHHSAMLEIAKQFRPGCDFQYALNRGGWYRLGGVIASDGRRVTDALDTWAKAELADCDEDMAELVERHLNSGLLVTRHTGCTHYVVAAYGPAPADFLQLEVEELQEVLDRKLIDVANPPDDIQELIEPINPGELDAQPVAAPRYRFRRLIDMRQTVQRTSAANGRLSPLARILSEWAHSAAATRGHFCDHWIAGLREHQDRYRNPILSVSLIARRARELKPFHWNVELSGVEMGAQLQAFDRAAGYPAAWYFHLIAGTITPPKIADAIAQDLDAGFSYLPETEVALLRNWLDAPYSV